MGVRIFAAASLVFACLSCGASLLVVAVGPEGKGVTVDGAWAVVALAFVGAMLAFVAVTWPNGPSRRTVITSLVGVCLAGGSWPLLFALAER
ncbi:MAG: hypothetical protein H0U32_04315 [Thermoleophilaceae bacterium]|nr:hypothetical protein [Thermoleophilaceae bacterium]